MPTLAVVSSPKHSFLKKKKKKWVDDFITMQNPGMLSFLEVHQLTLAPPELREDKGQENLFNLV